MTDPERLLTGMGKTGRQRCANERHSFCSEPLLPDNTKIQDEIKKKVVSDHKEEYGRWTGESNFNCWTVCIIIFPRFIV